MKCDGCGKIVVNVRFAARGPWTGKYVCRECWTAPRLVDVRFGVEVEWKDFERRYPRFLVRWPELERVINAVVSRKCDAAEPAEKLFFLLGRLSVEDFVEIFLNAGNGYGVAGLKLLRPMFERLVTMIHLVRNPKDVRAFLDYHHVHSQKLVRHIKDGGDDPARYFSQDTLREIETNYGAVSPELRKMRSWTKIDLATMARRVGLGMEYVSLSYFPTLQLHTTVTGLLTRLDPEDPAVIAFRTGSQRKEADMALWGAHLCLARLLEEQINYFQLPLSAARVREIFEDCWPGDPGEPNPAGSEEREE
jgi:hypothetical protein